SELGPLAGKSAAESSTVDGIRRSERDECGCPCVADLPRQHVRVAAQLERNRHLDRSGPPRRLGVLLLPRDGPRCVVRGDRDGAAGGEGTEEGTVEDD